MHHERPQHDDPLSHVERAKSHIEQIAASATTGIAAGLVSHEVRNLLTPAIAYVQLALRDPSLKPEVRHSLANASTAMRRACEVSELVLACYRSSPTPTLPATCDVRTVVDDCLNALGLTQPDSAIVVTRDVTPHLEVAIPPEALRHVILNLLLNAQAAFRTTHGSIAITSSTGNAGGEVAISIHDSGRGIPPEQLRSLNRELSAREGTEGVKTNDGGGPEGRGVAWGGGFGLILCRHLLEPHGAHLTLDSAPGLGTTATLTIHLSKSARSLQAA